MPEIINAFEWYLAGIRSLPGVHSLVVLQLVLGIERHGARSAFERFVPGMYAEVTGQIATLKYIIRSYI